MIISVLERRSEIGLRRALGATKRQIRTQFLAESILLAVIGGIVGVLAGIAATAVYASSKRWAVVIPVEAWSGGIASAILIGAFAGLMPAVRASRMPPTVALRTVWGGDRIDRAPSPGAPSDHGRRTWMCVTTVCLFLRIAPTTST
jgi:putative ABC transport system permease protein